MLCKALSGRTLCIQNSDVTDGDGLIAVAELMRVLEEREGIPSSELRLLAGTRDLVHDELLTSDEAEALPMLHMLLHLDGGKGGFGSMLRALGKEMRVAKGEDANMDACRDINGRRIRHVNSEKKLTEWYAMEKERKDEEELKRKEHAVATRDVKEQYLQVERDAVIEASKAVTVTIGNAVRQGLKAKKRKNKEMKQGNNDDEAGPSKPQAEQAASAVPGSPSFKKPKTESKKLFNEVGNPAEGPAPAPAAEAAKEFDPIDLQKAKSQKDLEAYGLDHVKAELMRRGIKCGGTLEQRCERLWAVRGPPELTGEAVPEELKAGGGKPKNHKKEKKRSN